MLWTTWRNSVYSAQHWWPALSFPLRNCGKKKLSLSLRFQSFSLYHHRVTDYYWDECINAPKMTFNTTMSMVPVLHWCPRVPNVSALCFYDQPFSSYRCDKWTEWLQNDIEHYKVKGTQVIQLKCSPIGRHVTRFPQWSNLKTRGPRTLALCLTAAVGITLAIFCRLVSKTHCGRLNQLKPGLTQYLTMHGPILDQIRYLNFDLSGSLKVKCDSKCHWTTQIWFPVNFK